VFSKGFRGFCVFKQFQGYLCFQMVVGFFVVSKGFEGFEVCELDPKPFGGVQGLRFRVVGISQTPNKPRGARAPTAQMCSREPGLSVLGRKPWPPSALPRAGGAPHLRMTCDSWSLCREGKLTAGPVRASCTGGHAAAVSVCLPAPSQSLPSKGWALSLYFTYVSRIFLVKYKGTCPPLLPSTHMPG
jgi:hypothetical protein